MGTWIAMLTVAATMSTEPSAQTVPALEIDARDVAPRVDARAKGGERVREALARAERDFARSRTELGLVGASPLFGAEGLPKPQPRS